MDDNNTLNELKDAIETSGAKMTFGFTQKNIEVIKRNLNRFERAEYSYQVWQDIGAEIGWVPLAAALWYFERKDKINSDKTTLK